jgi:DNA primase large subunit
MATLEELKFAQKFPFTSTARKIVEEKNFSLHNIPPEVINRAKVIALPCAKKQCYLPIVKENREILENEILAFPTAKIMVSILHDSRINEQFAYSISKAAFKKLNEVQNLRETLIDLSGELEVKFELSDEKNFFFQVPVTQFLEIFFRDQNLKLVNQQVSEGKVFLTEKDFARFLSELIYQRVYSSLPVDLKNIPPILKNEAQKMAEDLKLRQRKQFKEFLGKLDINAFPPCIAEMYADISEGKNIVHLARFHLATFLSAVNMPAEKIIELFKNTPNFDERVTRYQVERLSGKGGNKYSPPNCAKTVTNQLCKRTAECDGITSPMQFYRRKHLISRKKEK